METIAAILFFGIAVWYLCRRFKHIIAPDQSSCGCIGCGNCSAVPKSITGQMAPNAAKCAEIKAKGSR